MLTVNDVVTISLSVLGGVGGSALVVWKLSDWLGKVWANRILEKDRLKYQKELEAVKTELGLASQEYLIRFSSLHNQRADIIDTLYKKCVASDRAMSSILKLFQEAGEPSPEEKIKDFAKTFNDFYLFYYDKKIYFSPSLCEQIDNLATSLKHIHIDLTTYPVDTKSPEYSVSPELLRERSQYWREARQNYTNISNPLKTDIEKEFRELLGVK